MAHLVWFKNVQVSSEVARPMRLWLLGHRDAKITSGYRDPAKNKRVGGSPTSRHLVGTAVDVVGPAATLDHLHKTARQHGATEVLRESDHLHVAWPRRMGAST